MIFIEREREREPKGPMGLVELDRDCLTKMTMILRINVEKTF